MYDHIGLRITDLDASVRFYEAALGALGHVLSSRDAHGAGFGPKDLPALWLHLVARMTAVCMSHSVPALAQRWTNSMRRVSTPAAGTMALPACEQTTGRNTMRLF